VRVVLLRVCARPPLASYARPSRVEASREFRKRDKTKRPAYGQSRTTPRHGRVQFNHVNVYQAIPTIARALPPPLVVQSPSGETSQSEYFR
jgi:hypothetical protein